MFVIEDAQGCRHGIVGSVQEIEVVGVKRRGGKVYIWLLCLVLLPALPVYTIFCMQRVYEVKVYMSHNRCCRLDVYKHELNVLRYWCPRL